MKMTYQGRDIKFKKFVFVFFIYQKASVSDLQYGVGKIFWSVFIGGFILFEYGGVSITGGIGININMRTFELYAANRDFSEYELEKIQRGIGSFCRNQVMVMLVPEAVLHGK